MTLPVELCVGGHIVHVMLQDLSRSGMFLELTPPLPVGTDVRVTISPEGRRRTTGAVVTHSLSQIDARLLGRVPGVGIVFCEPVRPADELFAIAVKRLLRARGPGPATRDSTS